MYIMATLILGAFVAGCSGRLAHHQQTRVAFVLAVAATAAYFWVQGAM
ncbi:MAG: hypothetical protein M1118_05480 [Chloroflexi bacterium]|nr:hypothetical protein [Chloroflexota bacterium]